MRELAIVMQCALSRPPAKHPGVLNPEEGLCRQPEQGPRVPGSQGPRVPGKWPKACHLPSNSGEDQEAFSDVGAPPHPALLGLLLWVAAGLHPP